jgi:hypothetical protein
MNFPGNAINLVENLPLWAVNVDFPDVIARAIEADALEIRNCMIGFDTDGVLVIRPMPGVQS